MKLHTPTCTHVPIEYVYVCVWIPAWPSLKIAIHLDSRSVAKLFTSAKENRETCTTCIYDRIGHILFRGAHIFLFVQSMKLHNIKTICHCQSHVWHVRTHIATTSVHVYIHVKSYQVEQLTWVFLLRQLFDQLAHVALLQSSNTHWKSLQDLQMWLRGLCYQQCSVKRSHTITK